MSVGIVLNIRKAISLFCVLLIRIYKKKLKTDDVLGYKRVLLLHEWPESSYICYYFLTNNIFFFFYLFL